MEHFLLFSIVLTVITMISILVANPQAEELENNIKKDTSIDEINEVLDNPNSRSSIILLNNKELKKEKNSIAERAPAPSAPEVPGSSDRSNTSTRLGTS